MYDDLLGFLSAFLLLIGPRHLNSSAKRPILKLPLAIAFLAVLVLWPVVGVSRPMAAEFLTKPQLTVYAMAFFTACIAYWEDVAAVFAFNKDNLNYRLNVLSWCVYLSLFLTSCLLCRRLKVCLLDIQALPPEVGSWIGPPIFFAGTLLILRSLSETRSQKPVLLEYPQFFGLLLMLFGTSIAHWAWFPLLAIPGVLVVEAWYIANKQQIEAAKNDVKGLNARFKILPFIY